LHLFPIRPRCVSVAKRSGLRSSEENPTAVTQNPTSAIAYENGKDEGKALIALTDFGELPEKLKRQIELRRAFLVALQAGHIKLS
jgi:hypothetical protein